MKYRFIVLCCLLFAALTTVTHALPLQCLQAIERQHVCPNLIYKKAALPVAFLEIEQGDIICICLSDFKGGGRTAMSKVAQIDHHVTLQRIAKKYQLSEQDILTLLRN
jgi:hypothetical protein